MNGVEKKLTLQHDTGVGGLVFSCDLSKTTDEQCY